MLAYVLHSECTGAWRLIMSPALDHGAPRGLTCDTIPLELHGHRKKLQFIWRSIERYRLARGVERFVRSGGGLVLAGDASRAASIAALSAWRSLAREVAPLGSSAEDSAWRGMSRVPFTAVESKRVRERTTIGGLLLARTANQSAISLVSSTYSSPSLQDEGVSPMFTPTTAVPTKNK